MAQHNNLWGWGTWNSIHATGAWATTDDRIKFFDEWIRMITKNLECGDCINHATEYIKNNPPEQSEDRFIWTWRFHNAVNRRIGKPEVDYQTASKKWLGGGVVACTSGCGEGNTQSSGNKTAPAGNTSDRFRPKNY